MALHLVHLGQVSVRPEEVTNSRGGKNDLHTLSSPSPSDSDDDDPLQWRLGNPKKQKQKTENPLQSSIRKPLFSVSLSVFFLPRLGHLTVIRAFQYY